MNRRAFLSLISAAALPPFAARAQQKAMPVIGILAAASPDNAAAQRNVAAFRDSLAEAGYVEGKNVAIEYRWASTELDRLPDLAAELVARKVDLIVTEGGDDPVRAAKGATATIPIVFHTNVDPVKSGFVASLARPGGNLTGVSLHVLAAKRLEMICELVPSAKVIAVIVNPNTLDADDQINDTREAARAKGVLLHVIPVRTEGEIEPAFAGLKKLRAEAVIVVSGVLFSGRMSDFVALAARYAVPTMYPGRSYVEIGGLLSYGFNFPAMYRQKGIYAARILKGAKPADLPVEQPSKFELLVNQNTANTLGLTVPHSLLLRADEVIE